MEFRETPSPQSRHSRLKYKSESMSSRTLKSPNLVCGICGNHYRQPRILPCLHSFCTDCISNLPTYQSKEDGESSCGTDHTGDWLISTKSAKSSDNIFDGADCKREIPPGTGTVTFEPTKSLPRGKSRHAKLIEKRMKRSQSCVVAEIGIGNDVESENLHNGCPLDNSIHRTTSSHRVFRHDKKIACESNGKSAHNLLNISSSNGTNNHERVLQRKNTRVVLCPECMKEVRISITLEELPRNFMLERLSAHEVLLRSPSELRCDSCCDDEADDPANEDDDRQKSVTARCVVCQENLCALCEFAHRRQKKTKTHKLISLNKTRLPSESSSDSTTTISGSVQNEQGAKEDTNPRTDEKSTLLKKVTRLKLPNLHRFGRLLQKDVKNNVAGSDTRVQKGHGHENGDVRGAAGKTSDDSTKENNGLLQQLSSPIRCPTHQTEELRMFCVTCEETICRDCVLFEHRDHSCHMVTRDFFQEQMEGVNELIKDVSPTMEQMDSHLDTLSELKVKVTERCRQVKDEINNFMDLYVDAIEKHRDNLLVQVARLAENKSRSLDHTQQHLQDVRGDIERTCHFVAQLLLSGTDLEVLALKNLLMDRLEGHLQQVPREPQGKLNGFLTFSPTEKGEVINNFQMFGGVVARQPCAAKSFLSEEGLTTARIGMKCALHLTICDADGVTYTDKGVSVRAWLIAQEQQLQHIKVQTSLMKDGYHQISFVPTGRGGHFLHVTINGQPIKESPFKFKVKSRWRRHDGVWHCCSVCSSGGRRNFPCGCTALLPGGGAFGCSHAHPGHPGGHHWSCCGKMTQDSECSGRMGRKNSPVKEVTL